MSANATKRSASEAHLGDRSEDDAKMLRLTAQSLSRVAANLEHSNKAWIEARTHFINHAVALLVGVEAQIEDFMTTTDGTDRISSRVLLPGDKPHKEKSSVGRFSDHFSAQTPGITKVLAQASPELAAYFEKERSQSTTYANGDNFSEQKDTVV